jgi:hypothetical protein
MNTNIIYIKDINLLIRNFLITIDSDDIKIYFMDKKIDSTTNFNDWVVTEINEKESDFIKINVEYSVECLKKIDPSLLNKNHNLNYNLWKLCIFDDMFFNLPFTLDDVIFIPKSYVKSSMNDNSNLLNYLLNKNGVNKKFSKTLIHEKIHLLQRYNQDIWDKYILENTNWRITNKDLLIKCTLINNNHIIYNPDTYYVNNKFMFLDNEKYYYGKLIFNNKRVIDTIWFQIDEQKDKINLYVDINFNKKYEHPYEELAYNMAEKLHNN